jgi:VirK protein
MMSRFSLSARGLITCAAGILIVLSSMAAPARAASATMTFNDVLAALQSGKTVKVLTNLSQCSTADTKKPGPPIQGGLQINSFMVVPGKGVLFSDVHQALDASEKPVTEYIRYTLGLDSKVTLAVTRLTAAGAVKQDPLVCGLSGGATFVW